MKIRVLFVCTENSCRSQMAEAFLRQRGGDTFEVLSAGADLINLNPMASRS
jgi:arsenate reductase (thioredoxin)